MNWPTATNSGYASLVQSGMQAMSAAVVKPNTSAIYNRAYAQQTQKRNALEVQHKGELSLAAAKLKGVKQRTAIGMSQDVVEANIRAAAAVAGVKGSNVTGAIDQTQAEEAFRTADQAVMESNEIELALQQVYGGSQASRIPTDDYSGSLIGGVMSGLSKLDSNYFKDLGLSLEDSPNKLTADQYKVDFGDRTSTPGGQGGV
jgi:hypothetical protein